MSVSKERKLWNACSSGHLDLVKHLASDPSVNVNWGDPKWQRTTFFMACENGNKEVVSLLLGDMRIDINKSDNDQCTPLWFASQNGHLPVVQLILASGREVDTKTKSIAGTAVSNNKTAAEMARFQGTRGKDHGESDNEFARKHQMGPFIAALLDSFDSDPATTRQQLWELPEIRDSFMSDLFALVVILCDGLLSVSTGPSSSTSPTTSKAARFFQIAHCLPIEVQMLLCNRAFGAGKNSVLTKHSEPSFKKLGKLFASSEGLEDCFSFFFLLSFPANDSNKLKKRNDVQLV